MNIKNTILKIIKEETELIGERTIMEKSIKDFADMVLQDYDLPKDFYGVAVDIYKDDYSNKEKCQITALFKKPFSSDNSEKLMSILKDVKREAKSYFGEEFFDINSSCSTIDSYNRTYEYYFRKKNKKD